MIWIVEEGDYERREVVEVYEAPDGLDLSMLGFLISLGLRARPGADAPLAEANRWFVEMKALRDGLGDSKTQWQRYLAWIDSLPEVRKVPFECCS